LNDGLYSSSPECTFGWITCNDENKVVAIVMRDKSFNKKFPPELARLPYLQQLLLDNIGLIGTLPETFSNMWNIVNISLSGNSLTGSIPDFPMPKRLKRLDLSNNKLRGRVPVRAVSSTKLEHLVLGNNRLTSIPQLDDFEKSELQLIDVSANHLKGSLGNMTGYRKLEYFNVSGNLLT